MYNNPYFNMNQGFNPMQRVQPMETTTQPMNTQTYIQPIQATNSQPTILGKSVDSIEVVKATDIPLDGSISYFPLTDGTAIVTKQLKADGTSKTTIYKPIEEQEEDKVQYATIDEIKKLIDDIDLSEIDELKDEIKDLKSQVKKLKKGE